MTPTPTPCQPPPPPGGCYECPPGSGVVICADGPYSAPVGVPGPSDAGLALSGLLVALVALRGIRGRK